MKDTQQPPLLGNRFPSGPEKMSDKELVAFVSDGAVKIAVFSEAFRPFYLELRERFAKKPKTATIEGYRTWDEYCTKVFDRTRRAVNYFLAGGNPVANRSPVTTRVAVSVEKVPDRIFDVSVRQEVEERPARAKEIPSIPVSTAAIQPALETVSRGDKPLPDAHEERILARINRDIADAIYHGWPGLKPLTPVVRLLRDLANRIEEVPAPRKLEDWMTFVRKVADG